MKRNTDLPELLAPAGSYEAAIAALYAGADAIYVGGRMLNARMNATNFTDQ
jgi:putative protease